MQTRIEQSVNVDEIREKYDTGSIGFLLFINKSGVSSTSVHYMEDGKKNFYEMCALFQNMRKRQRARRHMHMRFTFVWSQRSVYDFDYGWNQFGVGSSCWKEISQ